MCKNPGVLKFSLNVLFSIKNQYGVELGLY